MSARERFVPLITVLLVAASCGGGGTESTTESSATVAESSTTSTSQVEDVEDVALEPGELAIGLVGCQQIALILPVDPEAVRPIVPDEHELFLDAGGKVPLIQVAKTCGDIVVDGASLGPGHFDTQWVQITGPEEQRTYPDHPDVLVLPTDYLYPLNFTTDNEAYQRSVADFGVPITLADSMMMDPHGPGTETGSVESSDGDYAWTVDNVTEATVPVFFVHVLERRDGGMDYRYEIECPAMPRFSEGPARLTLAPGSTLAAALGAEGPEASGTTIPSAVGPELDGLGWAFDVDCEATIERTLPVEVTEDVAYSATKQLDVYAPAAGAGYPAVVYFHGGDPTRNPTYRKSFAAVGRPLAGQGVVVFVPQWASLGPAGGSQDTICAMAFVQQMAEDYGGDPERVTLAGYSSGGFTAAIHGLIGDDPPLADGGDCLVDPMMEPPAAVVAGAAPFFAVDAVRAGAYADLPEWNVLTSEQLDAFDPYLALGRNLDVPYVLVVGEDDVGGPVAPQPLPMTQSTIDYHQAMVDAGYDAELVTLPGGHWDVGMPGGPSFGAWLDIVGLTARGER